MMKAALGYARTLKLHDKPAYTNSYNGNSSPASAQKSPTSGGRPDDLTPAERSFLNLLGHGQVDTFTPQTALSNWR